MMRKFILKVCGRKSETGRGFVVIFCCALLVGLSAGGVSLGQAGRRVSKPKSDPPVPKAEAAPTPVKEKTPEPEKTPVLVASNSPQMLRTSMDAEALMQGAVVQRLRDSKTLQVAVGESMSRGEAHKRAKNTETKTHVVWLELRNNGFADATIGANRTSNENIHIEYVVFEPGTGKVKSQGSVYLRLSNSGRIGGVSIGRSLPRCYPQPMYSVEFALIEAGIETAERIFRSLSLPNPPLCS